MGNGLVMLGFRVSWGLVAVIPFGTAWPGRKEAIVGCAGR